MRALKQLIGFEMPKNIDELIKESIKLRYPFQHFATVMIQDRQGIIKGVSQSKPNNLILDNFGLFLAGLMRAPVITKTWISLTDSGGAARNVGTYGQWGANEHAFNLTNAAAKMGTLIQVGAGTTPAARADEDVETPFGVAPEDDVFDTGTGSYGVGSIACAGAISAGGAGTINEVCFFGAWLYSTGAGVALANFLLFHDILVSGEAFVLGETITAAYTINL